MIWVDSCAVYECVCAHVCMSGEREREREKGGGGRGRGEEREIWHKSVYVYICDCLLVKIHVFSIQQLL